MLKGPHSPLNNAVVCFYFELPLLLNRALWLVIYFVPRGFSLWRQKVYCNSVAVVYRSWKIFVCCRRFSLSRRWWIHWYFRDRWSKLQCLWFRRWSRPNLKTLKVNLKTPWPNKLVRKQTKSICQSKTQTADYDSKTQRIVQNAVTPKFDHIMTCLFDQFVLLSVGIGSTWLKQITFEIM